jgi:glycine cleavage system H protein
MYPTDRKYTREHEWVIVEGDRGRVGITDYAQKELGDVVYLELPAVGKTCRQGEVFGSVESVKAVSDLFSPLSGEVVEVNSDLANKPEAINTNPHGSWMIVVRLSNPEETSALLDAAQYEALVK